MSFSKAKVKRFNDLDSSEYSSAGKCITNGRLSGDNSMIAAADRSTDITDNAVCLLPKAPTNIQSVSKKTTRHSMNMPSKRRRAKSVLQESEIEIRRLLQERSNLLKQLTTKDEERIKINSRLKLALRERSSFQASVASFEKENKELRRVNEILKVKVNTFEGAGRRKDVNMELANLRVLLVNKNHEISDLRHEIHTIREDHELEAICQARKGRDVFKINCTLVEIMKNLNSELQHSRENISKLQLDNTELHSENIAIRLGFLEEKFSYYQSMVNEQIQLVEESSDHGSCTQYEISTEKDDTDFKIEDLESISPFPERSSLEDFHGKESSFSSCSEFNESVNESHFVDKEKHSLILEATKEELDNLQCEIVLSELMCSTMEQENQDLCEQLSNVHNSYFTEKEKCESLQRQLILKEHAAELKESMLNSKIATIQGQLESLQREVVLKEEAAASKEIELILQISNAQHVYQKTVEEIISLESKIEDILSIDNSIFGEFKTLLQSKSAIISCLTEQVEEVDKLVVLENAQDALGQSMSEFEEMEEKISVLENKHVENQKKMNILLEHKRLFDEKLAYFEVLVDILVKCCNRRHQENIELLSSLEFKAVEVAAIKKDLQTASCALTSLQSAKWDLEHKQEKLREEVVVLDQKLSQQLKSNEEHLETIAAQQMIIGSVEKSLQECSHELAIVKDTLEQEKGADAVLQKALEESNKLVEELSAQLQAVTTENSSAKDKETIEELTIDCARWKTEYETLKEKIAPFQEQLDAYSMEREMLMSQNQETMDNLKSLSLQYATLLGHQNHKQKIHYMVNLKEENFNLKEEVAKLRAEALKLRTSIHKRDGPCTPVSVKKAPVHSASHSSSAFKDGHSSRVDL